MFTGEDDMNNLGKIATWEGREFTNAFEGECGRVTGSADGLFPPGLALVSDTLSMFSTDLCRPIRFSKSDHQTLHGIPVTTFELAADNFANTTVCPDNECYQNNIPSGVQVKYLFNLFTTYLRLKPIKCHSTEDADCNWTYKTADFVYHLSKVQVFSGS